MKDGLVESLSGIMGYLCAWDETAARTDTGILTQHNGCWLRANDVKRVIDAYAEANRRGVFVVFADEPYAKAVAALIKNVEDGAGTWTPKDEAAACRMLKVEEVEKAPPNVHRRLRRAEEHARVLQTEIDDLRKKHNKTSSMLRNVSAALSGEKEGEAGPFKGVAQAVARLRQRFNDADDEATKLRDENETLRERLDDVNKQSMRVCDQLDAVKKHLGGYEHERALDTALRVARERKNPVNDDGTEDLVGLLDGEVARVSQDLCTVRAAAENLMRVAREAHAAFVSVLDSFKIDEDEKKHACLSVTMAQTRYANADELRLAINEVRDVLTNSSAVAVPCMRCASLEKDRNALRERILDLEYARSRATTTAEIAETVTAHAVEAWRARCAALEGAVGHVANRLDAHAADFRDWQDAVTAGAARSMASTLRAALDATPPTRVELTKTLAMVDHLRKHLCVGCLRAADEIAAVFERGTPRAGGASMTSEPIADDEVAALRARCAADDWRTQVTPLPRWAAEGRDIAPSPSLADLVTAYRAAFNAPNPTSNEVVRDARNAMFAALDAMEPKCAWCQSIGCTTCGDPEARIREAVEVLPAGATIAVLDVNDIGGRVPLSTWPGAAGAYAAKAAVASVEEQPAAPGTWGDWRNKLRALVLTCQGFATGDDEVAAINAMASDIEQFVANALNMPPPPADLMAEIERLKFERDGAIEDSELAEKRELEAIRMLRDRQAFDLRAATEHLLGKSFATFKDLRPELDAVRLAHLRLLPPSFDAKELFRLMRQQGLIREDDEGHLHVEDRRRLDLSSWSTWRLKLLHVINPDNYRERSERVDALAAEIEAATKEKR